MNDLKTLMRQRAPLPATLAALALLLSFHTGANAAYTLNIAESGNDVVANGSGTIDTANLSLVGGGFTADYIGANEPPPGFIDSFGLGGSSAGSTMFVYVGTFTGPAFFGVGAGIGAPTTASGNYVAFEDLHDLKLEQTYVSGASLVTHASFHNQTFASIGLTPGDYVYTWGTGIHADSLTISIQAAPEPASMAVLGIGLAGIAVVRRRRARREQV